MSNPFDAMRRQVPSPASAVPAAEFLPLAQQSLPLPQNMVMMTKASPAEEKYLDSIGWKQKLVPSNIVEIDQAIKANLLGVNAAADSPEAIMAELRAKLGSNAPPTLQAVKIESLPPEKQAMYRQMIDETSRIATIKHAEDLRLKEEMGDIANYAPGVANAIRQTHEQQQAARLAPAQTPVTEPVPPAETKASPPEASPQPPAYKPTEEELSTFFVHVLSGSPYVKTFKLARGKMELRLRTLSMDEVEAIRYQVEKDNPIATTAGDFNNRIQAHNTYRLCLQLFGVKSDYMNFQMPMSLKDWPQDVLKMDNPLAEIKRIVHDRIGGNTVLYGLISQAHEQFLYELSVLQDAMSAESF